MMQQTKRPTKLEEATFKVHLDVDKDHSAMLDKALFKIKQAAQLVIGQDDVENCDVSLGVEIIIRERKESDNGQA